MFDIINFIKEYVLVFFILISILVFVHEYGHYLFAKMFKVKVESFSIGFGKEIFGWTDKSGTRWKIAPIPFGGYVKMKGEMIETETTEDDKDKDNDSFSSKTLLQKSLIVFAGPLFNLIFPIFILFFISFFAGFNEISPKVNEVMEDTPAHNILYTGDTILSVNEKSIKTFSDLQQIIASSPNQNTSLKVLRDSNVINLEIVVGSREERGYTIGFLGITPSMDNLKTYRYDFLEAWNNTYNIYTDVTTLIIKGVGNLLIGNINLDDIGGPVRIAEVSADYFQQGLTTWMFFVAMLSINLAIINLLPIPALDGGHLLMYAFQGITGKKLSPKVQNIFLQLGFIFLMTIMALVIIKDILYFIMK